MRDRSIVRTLIRPARIDEADELTALCMVSKQSNGYDGDFMALCADELRVTPSRILGSMFCVAEREYLCGCACLHIEHGTTTGDVRAFFVHPDCQGQGVGGLLWKRILKCAQSRGLSRIHLDADPFAESFYTRLGFRTIGQSPSGSIAGRTIPHMELILV